MATNEYTNAASGNATALMAKAELLASADAVTVSDPFIKTERVPKNKNETILWYQAVTPDVDTTETPEGQTKALRALTYNTVQKTFQEFTEGFSITSRQADLGERDVLMESKGRLIDLISRTREQNGWITWRNGNNVIFNSNAITVITAVNGPPTLGRFRKVSRLLENNRGPKIKEMTNGSVNQDTSPVEPAYVVFCHTDCKADIRELPGFVVSAKIGGGNKRVPEHFGNTDDFMFICCQEFTPRLAAGAAVASLGMKSVGAVNIDVYDYVCFAKEAFGRLALAGSESKKGMGGVEFNVLDKPDKSDPFNMTRVVTARWWDGPVILDQARVCRIAAAVTDNPA